MIDRIKENKRFYGVAAGLVATLFLWNMMVRSGIADRTAILAHAVAGQKAQLESLSQKGSVTQEQIDPAHEAIKDVGFKLTTLAQRVKFVLDPRFEVPKDQTAMNFFLDRRLKSKELSESAIKKGISWNGKIQQLNFNPVPSNEDEALEHLIRLDLVYRILETIYAVLGDPSMAVQRIEDVQPLIGGGPQGGLVVVKERFLSKVKVAVKFRSNGMAAFRIVHSLGSAEKMKNRGALTIEDFVVERPDATVDQVDVYLVVSAVIVDVTKPLTEGGP